jgi:hypothetical protein
VAARIEMKGDFAVEEFQAVMSTSETWCNLTGMTSRM